MSNPTRAQVAAFAEAVAASGSPAMLIDEQNRNAGFVPIREAARLGFAFAVQVDSRILAVDIDEPGAETKLFRLVSAVTDVGLESVVVRSGRPGHHHLFASIDDLGFGNDLRAWGRIERFDVRGPGQRIRPPLAPHRMRDLRVSLADPLDAGEALARLRPPELRAATQTVPQTVRQLLETAKGSDWFPSRSEALFYVEQELVAAGYSDDRICDLILKGPLGAKAREKRRPRGWLLADIERARRKRRSHSPVVDSRFVSIEDALDTYTWAGRHHQSVRVVLQAHITIAARTSGVVYGGSERELAELAGITRKTVRKANETAIRLGFLQRIEVGSNQHSTRWRLRRPADVLQLPQSTPRGGCDEWGPCRTRCLPQPIRAPNVRSIRLCGTQPDPGEAGIRHAKVGRRALHRLPQPQVVVCTRSRVRRIKRLDAGASDP